MKMREVIQKMNTIDLEVRLQILRGLLEVDQNQTLPVLLQDLISRLLHSQDHQLLNLQIQILENLTLDHPLVHLYEVDQLHLLP